MTDSKTVYFRKPVQLASRCLPPLNFITIHYVYFIATCLVSSVILWGSSNPAHRVSYIDALFLATSAMTLSGLNTVNLSSLNTFQQVVLFLLLILGSAVLVSSVVVHVRKRAFEKRFHNIVEREKQRRLQRTSRGNKPPRLSLSYSFSRNELSSSVIDHRQVSQERALSKPRMRGANDTANAEETTDSPTEQSHKLDQAGNLGITRGPNISHIGFESTTTIDLPDRASRSRNQHGHGHHHHHHHHHHRSHVISMQGVGAHPDAISPSRHSFHQATTFRDSTSAAFDGNSQLTGRPSYQIDRNSQFHGLTSDERDTLGGVEYRALSAVALIVPAYLILWQLLGCLSIGAWVAKNKPNVARTNGLNPWWLGAFNAVSAFNNSGMSLLDANMVPFQSSFYILITMGLLVLAGNTCYPVFLRVIIWALRHTPYLGDWKEALQFLLDHPRRCYTNLFPLPHTLWLLAVVVVLNGIDWIAFEVLNIGNKAITNLPADARAMDGLFQALAVRSGGFYVVTISSLRIGLQALYVVMMYISVYPVVITMRNSNVYEERSLGIYADDPHRSTEETSDTEKGTSPDGREGYNKGGTRASYFVGQQLRAQLAHDLWIIVAAVLLITIIETGQFEREPATYSVFNIMFEVMSGYGCVGISTGLPNESYSFSGDWHKLSKLILCIMMIRGRHRGLPVAIDRAVLLPGEHLAAAEEEDATIRMERIQSRKARLE